jgi:protein SCO1/2
MTIPIRRLILALLVCASVLQSGAVRAQAAGSLSSRIGFDQKLGATVPGALCFRDHAGREVRLGDYFAGRPVILALVYYRCPLLCNQVLSGLTRSLKALRPDPGKAFEVVAVSIDPGETPQRASQRRSAFLARYDRPDAESGWHFLAGDSSSIRELARSVGFRYEYNSRTGLYTHAAGIVILTPGGRVSRYFFGIDYPPRELEGQLERAATGQVGRPIGALLLLCYDYDEATGRYTLSILRLMRLLGTVTVIALGVSIYIMLRREWKGVCAVRGSSERRSQAPSAPAVRP